MYSCDVFRALITSPVRWSLKHIKQRAGIYLLCCNGQLFRQGAILLSSLHFCTAWGSLTVTPTTDRSTLIGHAFFRRFSRWSRQSVTLENTVLESATCHRDGSPNSPYGLCGREATLNANRDEDIHCAACHDDINLLCATCADFARVVFCFFLLLFFRRLVTS